MAGGNGGEACGGRHSMGTLPCVLSFWGKGVRQRPARWNSLLADSLVPALSSKPPAHCSPNNPLKHHFGSDVSPLSYLHTTAHRIKGKLPCWRACSCVCGGGVGGVHRGVGMVRT